MLVFKNDIDYQASKSNFVANTKNNLEMYSNINSERFLFKSGI